MTLEEYVEDWNREAESKKYSRKLSIVGDNLAVYLSESTTLRPTMSDTLHYCSVTLDGRFLALPNYDCYLCGFKVKNPKVMELIEFATRGLL
jgi:hypothetical protein